MYVNRSALSAVMERTPSCASELGELSESYRCLDPIVTDGNCTGSRVMNLGFGRADHREFNKNRDSPPSSLHCLVAVWVVTFPGTNTKSGQGDNFALPDEEFNRPSAKAPKGRTVDQYGRRRANRLLVAVTTTRVLRKYRHP
jgi:hypothetical protein